MQISCAEGGYSPSTPPPHRATSSGRSQFAACRASFYFAPFTTANFPPFHCASMALGMRRGAALRGRKETHIDAGARCALACAMHGLPRCALDAPAARLPRPTHDPRPCTLPRSFALCHVPPPDVSTACGTLPSRLGARRITGVVSNRTTLPGISWCCFVSDSQFGLHTHCSSPLLRVRAGCRRRLGDRCVTQVVATPDTANAAVRQCSFPLRNGTVVQVRRH